MRSRGLILSGDLVAWRESINDIGIINGCGKLKCSLRVCCFAGLQTIFKESHDETPNVNFEIERNMDHAFVAFQLNLSYIHLPFRQQHVWGNLRIFPKWAGFELTEFLMPDGDNRSIHVSKKSEWRLVGSYHCHKCVAAVRETWGFFTQM